MTPEPSSAAPGEKAIQRVAHGANDVFEQSFTHPQHGELVFRCELPRAVQLLDHQIAMDNLLDELSGSPRVGTQILAAALAGLRPDPDDPSRSVFGVRLPVVREERSEESESGKVTVVRHFYDADTEPDTGWLVDVWTAISLWRNAWLTPAAVDALGEDSGETSGPASSGASDESSASPSTTPA